jgi:hypothetical protein
MGPSRLCIMHSDEACHSLRRQSDRAAKSSHVCTHRANKELPADLLLQKMLNIHGDTAGKPLTKQ